MIKPCQADANSGAKQLMLAPSQGNKAQRENALLPEGHIIGCSTHVLARGRSELAFANLFHFILISSGHFNNLLTQMGAAEYEGTERNRRHIQEPKSCIYHVVKKLNIIW